MPPLRSRDDAWALIAARAAALPAVELPLEQAAGRVLAADVTSPMDIPSFDRSAMDGYAVRAADLPGRLRVEGQVAAGHAADAPLTPGTARRIFPGGPIPPGADAVERQEVVTVHDDGTIEIDHPLEPAANVRFRGEDVPAGTGLLRAGDPGTS